MPTKPTSLAAFYDIRDRGLLPKAQLRVYEFLCNCGPSTKGEVNHHLALGAGNPSYHRRLAELVDKGLARFTRVRKCAISGRDAEEFEAITSGMPKVLPRKKQPKLNQKTLDAVAKFVSGWHFKKGGYSQLAWEIQHLNEQKPAQGSLFKDG